MNKYSYIAIFTAILIGAAVSYFVNSGVRDRQVASVRKEYEKLLEDTNRKHIEQIENTNDSIKTLLEEGKKDSIFIVSLQRDILLHRTKVEHEREQAKTFTNSEKLDYLLTRYNFTIRE